MAPELQAELEDGSQEGDPPQEGSSEGGSRPAADAEVSTDPTPRGPDLPGADMAIEGIPPASSDGERDRLYGAPRRTSGSRRRRRSVRGARRVLLFVLLLMIGSIAGLLVFGRAGQVEEEPPTAAADQDLLEGEFVVVGEGFEQSVMVGDQLVFRIEAERTLSDREENVQLENVEIERPMDGDTYLIRGRKARYNVESKHALIEGDVEVRGPNDIVMLTDWLELRSEGRILVASRGTRFRAGTHIVGRARNLQFHLEEEILLLGGGVEVRTTEDAEMAFSLDARRARLDLRYRIVRAVGKVRFQRAGDELTADRFTLRLKPDVDRPEHVRTSGQVAGTFTPPAREDLRPQRISLTGEKLFIEFDRAGENLARLELEGYRRFPAVMVARDDLGARRELRGNMITGDFTGGRLSTADAVGETVLVEDLITQTGATVHREAHGLAGEASFDNLGNVVQLVLDGEVRLIENDLVATGDSATLHFASGRSRLIGDPVEVRSEQGSLEAPEVEYQHDQGLVRAIGGARTLLPRPAGEAAGPLGGDGPVRVVSSEALLYGGERDDFVFKGEVRAWQGRNLLLADQLRGDRAGSTLVATGGVKTIWHPPEEAATDVDEPPPASTTTPSDGSEDALVVAGAPVEVTSREMRYAQGDSTMTYLGSVVVLQANRLIRCDALTLELAEAGSPDAAESLDCRGSTRVEDPTTGRTVIGDRAFYRLADRAVTVWGEPLVVDDPSRGRVQGPELRYDFEKGSYVLGRSAIDEATDDAGAPVTGSGGAS